MITNFEEITKELTEEEKQLVTKLDDILSNRKMPIKSDEIVLLIKEHYPKFNEVKLRKLSNYIRTNGILPLMATSNGYFLAVSQEEVRREIKSLRERANSINSAANGLTRFLLPQQELF